MINRILLISLFIVSLFLCIAIFIAYHRGIVNEQQKGQIENLIANVNVLVDGRKKDYADKLEIAKRNEELEKLAKKDTACFGWNTDISNSPIVQRLRQD